MIEIYNPLDSAVDLSNYYLSDSDKYYQWINGESIGNFDFVIKFPNDLMIDSQETIVITTQSNLDFSNHYDEMPDISLVDTEFESFEFGINPNLYNSEEMLILFYWDGSSSTVQDVDYFLWGDYDKGVYKTTDEGYAYDDTPLEDQIFIRDYSIGSLSDSLYVRNNINENDEIQSGGNGYTGHDETSENIVASWSIIGIEKEISFQDIINGDHDCNGSSQDACPLGVGAPNCDIVNPMGVIVDYFDITPYGGPHALTIQDEEGYRLELTIWPDNWDIANDPNYSTLLDPPYNRFLVQAFGNVFEYDGEKQILVCNVGDFEIIETYDMDGIFDGEEDEEPYEDLNGNGQWDEEQPYNFDKAIINPAPYVLLASEDERLDYSYSFPSNSRVIIRVFDISGRFITTLADKHYESSGIVERKELSSSWDGRNHLGQVLPPGTYLMHMEASNFQTGKTSIDVAPVVIGVRNK